MTEVSPVRTLIVDDEAPARRRLEQLLEDRTDVAVAGLAEGGEEAVELIREIEPDLVFLDVQMPDLMGVEVVREIGPEEMPAVIFVTAYDEYAVEAFELAALDYLLKPFDNERFETAVDRAIETIEQQELGELGQRLSRLLDDHDEGGVLEDGGEDEYVERIAVKKRGQIRLVQVEDIDFIEASGAYAKLHAGDESHLLRARMKDLESRLDPEAFVRVHRSYIVRIDRIESLMVNTTGSYALRLTTGRDVSVSRRGKEVLEERLGLEL